MKYWRKLPQLACVLFIFTSCADGFLEEMKIKVISTDDNFSGFYSVDGSDSTSFTGTSKGNDNYEFTVKIEGESTVEVDASPIYTSGSSSITMLKIVLYDEDGNILDSEVDDDGEDAVQAVSITYDVGSSNDD